MGGPGCKNGPLSATWPSADMGKLRPAGQVRPAGPYTNLNSHREFSGRPFFPLEVMDGSDFQKISLNGAKLK